MAVLVCSVHTAAGGAEGHGGYPQRYRQNIGIADRWVVFHRQLLTRNLFERTLEGGDQAVIRLQGKGLHVRGIPGLKADLHLLFQAQCACGIQHLLDTGFFVLSRHHIPVYEDIADLGYHQSALVAPLHVPDTPGSMLQVGMGQGRQGLDGRSQPAS